MQYTLKQYKLVRYTANWVILKGVMLSERRQTQMILFRKFQKRQNYGAIKIKRGWKWDLLERDTRERTFCSASGGNFLRVYVVRDCSLSEATTILGHSVAPPWERSSQLCLLMVHTPAERGREGHDIPLSCFPLPAVWNAAFISHDLEEEKIDMWRGLEGGSIYVAIAKL